MEPRRRHKSSAASHVASSSTPSLYVTSHTDDSVLAPPAKYKVPIVHDSTEPKSEEHRVRGDRVLQHLPSWKAWSPPSSSDYVNFGLELIGGFTQHGTQQPAVDGETEVLLTGMFQTRNAEDWQPYLSPLEDFRLQNVDSHGDQESITCPALGCGAMFHGLSRQLDLDFHMPAEHSEWLTEMQATLRMLNENRGKSSASSSGLPLNYSEPTLLGATSGNLEALPLVDNNTLSYAEVDHHRALSIEEGLQARTANVDRTERMLDPSGPNDNVESTISSGSLPSVELIRHKTITGDSELETSKDDHGHTLHMPLQAESTVPKVRKRQKVGCLTCRKHRIRCGEERPICINCVKSKRQCEGYNQRVIFEIPIPDSAPELEAVRSALHIPRVLLENDISLSAVVFEHNEAPGFLSPKLPQPKFDPKLDMLSTSIQDPSPEVPMRDVWVDHDISNRVFDDDPDSDVSSYANSVISTASLASSATDLSLHNRYSATEIAKATQELIAILRDDTTLVPLYRAAIVDDCIGPERLERNLRRFFKHYADALKEEAGDTLQFQASRLMMIKAKDVARAIVQSYSMVKNSITQDARIRLVPDQVLEESEDDTEQQTVDEAIFGDLALLREFLLGSDSLVALRMHISAFVLPRAARHEMNEDMKVDFKHEEIGLGRYQKLARLFSVGKLSSRLSYITLQMIRRYLETTLIAVGYLEPPLQPGYTRLRWQCKCGDSSYGDVYEYNAGGIRKMVERMERSLGVKVTATTYNTHATNQRYSFKAPAWVRGPLQKISNGWGSPTKQSRCLPRHNNNVTAAGNIPLGNLPPSQDTLHLMACMQRGRYRRTVQQDRIDAITTDRALFCFMRTQIMRHRGWLRKFLSMKCVQGLYFVKFRLRICGSAEVRDHEPCCTSSPNKACECIPPATKVEPQPNAEYRCKPAGPLDVWPPVLSQELMHMLTSPHCIHENERFVLEQLPKRTKGELKGCLGKPVEGWGMYYQEGWDFDLVIGVVLVVFLIASLLFAVLWSVYKVDIQGAFGVSSYMVTASGIFIAWIANRAGKRE